MRSLKTEEKRIIHLDGYVAVEKGTGVFKVRGFGREFSLHQIDPMRWKVNGKSSTVLQGSRYQRLTVQAEHLADAVFLAVRRLFPEVRVLDQSQLEISDVLARWIETRTVSSHTERVYRDGIKRFLDWGESRGCLKWSDLSRGVLQEYLGSLKDYRSNYKKNLWKPIRGASLWASLEWPDEFRDIAARIQIKDTCPQFPDDKVALSLIEAADFCRFLSEDEEGARILLGVSLQSMVGLRLTEAFRLEWRSIDLDAGIVTVQGQVKGRDSVRRVPLPDFVLDLMNAIAGPKEGRILWAYAEHGNYAKAVSRLLRRWNPNLRLEPKGLRRTLESEAARRGWSGYAFNRFLGRAPGSIAERHYITVGGDLLEILRSQVTRRINQILQSHRIAPGGSDDNVIQLRTG